MKKNIDNLVEFYIEAEKLKATIRHCWTSDTTRTESVAEHSWMLNLMAVTLFEYIELEIDQLKILKMLTIHDLAEAVTGDIPAHEISDRQNQKQQNELAAMKKITSKLNKQAKEEILTLWLEFEEKQTNEAKLAQIIDKLEAALQHCIVGADKWDDGDFRHHGSFYKLDYTQVGKPVKLLRDAIGKLSIEKVTEAKQLDRLNDFIKQQFAQSLKQVS